MSQVIGFVLLAVIVLPFIAKCATELRDIYYRRRFMAVERIAMEEYRANRPIDRVAIIQDLVGALQPRLVRTLPAGTAVEETRRRIGSVRLASLAAPCDDITRPPFYTHRDFGDESPVC